MEAQFAKYECSCWDETDSPFWQPLSDYSEGVQEAIPKKFRVRAKVRTCGPDMHLLLADGKLGLDLKTIVDGEMVVSHYCVACNKYEVIETRGRSLPLSPIVFENSCSCTKEPIK